ncbi:hypothetical protein [Taibaiella helva]|uniref:hypothetical protein n=1 Tax=Taibaiella helva TaxID=2301235 RepID=UPI000E57BFDF|nr:hypothetical protein [Taibaiella helva]
MKTQIRSIRFWLLLFMTGLLLSGFTAFVVEPGLQWLLSFGPYDNALYRWLETNYQAISATNKAFPAIAYGYDWLAFAHIVIATAFIGPLIDPVRNVWVVQFGCIACLMIFPLAFIAGRIRHIPFFWQLIDCSFGVLGLVPLLVCYYKIRLLNRSRHSSVLSKTVRS